MNRAIIVDAESVGMPDKDAAELVAQLNDKTSYAKETYETYAVSRRQISNAALLLPDLAADHEFLFEKIKKENEVGDARFEKLDEMRTNLIRKFFIDIGINTRG